MKSIKKNNILLWLDYVAFAIIVIVFFVISYCGFYLTDDLSMAFGGIPTGTGMRIREISSFIDVFILTGWWYFHLGGRFFSVAAQYFFCGLLGDKIWFDIVNTLFFLLLMVICVRLIKCDNKNGVRYVLVFALLFWFLCPVPRQTLFWVAGSTTYLWANTLVFAFLLFFFKFKDDNFSIAGKIGLFVLSIFAATEFISCASICGAFVVYYAFHIKSFKRNAIPFVMGFVIGSILVLFAPGNFVRAMGGDILQPFRTVLFAPVDFLRASDGTATSFFDGIKEIMFNPIVEIKKYKVLWMFLIVLILGWIKNKAVIKTWMRNNAILLLSLAWSVVAFSLVFRPANRALFFSETMSLILFFKFLVDNYYVFGIRFHDDLLSRKYSIVWRTIIVLMFVVFILDSAFAITETKKQSKINDVLQNEIVDSGGVVALDCKFSCHRMANTTYFYEWTWEPLADKYGLDSVHVYPYFCQNKLYKQEPPFENVYIDDGFAEVILGSKKYVCLVIRIENEDLHEQNSHVTVTIDYTRPKKWYKLWLDKLRNYQYDRTEIVVMDKPEVCFNGYSYYVIYFGRENLSGLKSVKYEIE